MDILKVLARINGDADFEHSGDFLEDGLLDSFEVVDLVTELEEEFSIEISGADIVPENFKNLETITKLLQKYVGG